MDRESEMEGMGEFEGEFEEELEGEFEGELEMEGVGEFEGEFEGEEFLGTIAKGTGSLLGESEYEFEGEFEGEYEGEEFFRRIGRWVRRAAPVLQRIARVAAPIVGRAVGGFFGGPVGMQLGGTLGNLASRVLREEEMEFEMEGEFEEEWEDEAEGPVTHHEVLAEYMAAAASRVQNEAEAEAMIGAATATILSRADRAALRQVLPHMVRGTAILTRILRRTRYTRPAVRVVPTIVRGATTMLVRRAASGQPITRTAAARAMATQTRRVLGNPHRCAVAIQRNVRTARVAPRIVARTAPRATGYPRRPARW